MANTPRKIPLQKNFKTDKIVKKNWYMVSIPKSVKSNS